MPHIDLKELEAWAVDYRASGVFPTPDDLLKFCEMMIVLKKYRDLINRKGITQNRVRKGQENGAGHKETYQ